MGFTTFSGFNIHGGHGENVSINEPGFALYPVLINSGNTTTKEFRAYFGEPIKSVSPIERPDMRIPFDAKFTPIVIGPKIRKNGTMRPITMEEARSINNGKLHIYFWGNIYYHDIFDGTPEHRTFFCDEIGGISMSAVTTQNQLQIPVSVSMAPCMIHNCVDDECPAQ